MALDINLYAEFLMNVRSVTIYGTLRNKNTTYTKAYVSSDQKTISLTYDGQTTSIALPLGIKVKGSVGFPVPTDPSDLSLRLEILEEDRIPHGVQLEVENDLPWSAASLGFETEIACKGCGTAIVENGKRSWKDLPRGFWAETLDQWYCHRPEVKGVVQKDYAGSSGPQLEAGVAFVDTCHFVLPSDDCQALKIQENDLTCAQCSNQIGLVDRQLGGYRLYKWSIQVRRTASDPWEHNKAENFICAQMLELMEDQNVRKFLAFTGKLSEADHGILLWVFNPEIKYSSSRVNQGRPRRAMKVLYEKLAKPSVIAEKLQLAVEDLPLPASILEQLEIDLEAGHNVLPDPAKKFLPSAAMGNWKVSLLDRFDSAAQRSP